MQSGDMKKNHSSSIVSRVLGVVVVTTVFLAVWAGLAAAGERLRLAGADTFIDDQAGLMWQLDRSKRIKDLDDAEGVLVDLNGGDYSNWRFPSKVELFELFQIFDLKENGTVKTRLEGNYWLVDEDGSMKAGSWEIGDGCGPSRTFYEKKGGYVRAVRNMR